VVPILGPGISLAPTRGELRVDDEDRRVVRAHVGELTVALPRATFLEASWVPGREERSLSVVQGAARIDVHLET
jgi:hypothetical protein